MKSLTSNWRRSVVFFICISIRRNVFFHHLLTFIHSLPLSLSLAIFLIINLFEFDNHQEYSRWLPQIYFICTKFRANKLTTSIRNRCCVCVTFCFLYLFFGSFFSFHPQNISRFFLHSFCFGFMNNALRQSHIWTRLWVLYLYCLCVRKCVYACRWFNF